MTSVINPSSAGPLPGGAGFINPEQIVESFGLKEGINVADFGSGSGHFTLLIAKKVGPNGTVTALDILESTLEVIRSKAAANGLANLQTVRADLEVFGSSGLPDNSQNLVLIANILFQSNKKAEIIKEAQRIIVNGGSLVIIEWKKETIGLGPAMESRSTPEELKSIVQGLGLNFTQDIEAGAFHFGLMFKK
ncbi:MAG: methyltransferase domain-containing protein [bacterium]|nr:methyltransferase domain-containing protein [bacterium]